MFTYEGPLLLYSLLQEDANITPRDSELHMHLKLCGLEDVKASYFVCGYGLQSEERGQKGEKKLHIRTTLLGQRKTSIQV